MAKFNVGDKVRNHISLRNTDGPGDTYFDTHGMIGFIVEQTFFGDLPLYNVNINGQIMSFFDGEIQLVQKADYWQDVESYIL